MLKTWRDRFRLVSHFDKKFSLNEDVYLVKGAKHSAIYDLARGNVYSVDETVRNILDFALIGRTPKEISTQTDNNLYETIGFLNKLVEQGLGGWYDGSTRFFKSYNDRPAPLGNSDSPGLNSQMPVTCAAFIAIAIADRRDCRKKKPCRRTT